MSLDCSITDIIKADFNTLWTCSHVGNTLEITTPYRMPDSKLLTLYFTEREGRFICCDGGRIWELLKDKAGVAYKDVLGDLREIAEDFGLKESNNEGEPVFFKECRDLKLISSIAFDVANFSAMAASVLLATKPH